MGWQPLAVEGFIPCKPISRKNCTNWTNLMLNLVFNHIMIPIQDFFHIAYCHCAIKIFFFPYPSQAASRVLYQNHEFFKQHIISRAYITHTHIMVFIFNFVQKFGDFFQKTEIEFTTNKPKTFPIFWSKKWQ